MNWKIIALSTIIVFSLSVSESYSEELDIKEWDIPTPDSAPHDVVVGHDGMIWFTEIGTNNIGKFDPNTEQFSEYVIPTESSRPHGLVVDNQGNVWFTEVGAGQIGMFDPVTETFEEFATPTADSGPHTPIFADDDTLWFTQQRASKIGKMDTTTGIIEEFPTITPSANPYGIITDKQGNAWFAELRGHNIGKVDAKTGEVTEYLPLTDESGPRRIAIDSNGMLWFTQYNVGKISKFDPNTETMTEFDTSSVSSGPYAIWVDPFDNVWFSMTGTYKVGKFDQSTETLHEYDLPSPQTHIKFIHIDSKGNVWFPNYNHNKIGVILASASASQGIAYFPPPLKQIQNGAEPTSVTCTEGLELVLKFSNGNPACIRPSSVEKLTERGWAIHVLPDYQKNESNNSEIFAMGNFDVSTENVNYFENSQGYIARPVMDGNYPSIVMIHEFWGLNDNIKQMADKLASHGYVVFAVDLYDGKVGKTADEARQLRSSFEQSQWTDNMSTAVTYLEENYSPSSMGSIGWCFGGGQSLNLALDNPEMDATVIYYGQLVTNSEDLSKIDWPILGIFAELDNGIPPETVKEFESSLNDIGVENDITIYPDVNHAFANPSGDRYAPDEAMDAWNKTLKFFEQNLS
ncbi:virginiamycin B lyase family protein [Nitrosopumilus sp.]|uniref:virginiamycin B lyase family protein n=1 Tax=Nitrosopumilus sp. TaxID=2024843 RepID=UPI003D0AB664